MSLPNILLNTGESNASLTDDRNGAATSSATQQQQHPSSPHSPLSSRFAEPSGIKATNAADDCLLRYYHQMEWQVPFPHVPAAMYLHKPDVLKAVFQCPRGIMASEVDAMSTGILPEINLTYFPIRPYEVQQMRDIVKRNRLIGEEKNQQLIAQGQFAKTAWEASEINPDLHPDDRALLDTDLDVPFTEQRSKPSLTLLQRPTYTELGAVSKEERHEQRKKRLLGEAAVATAEYDAALQKAEELQRTWFDKLKRTFKAARGTDQLYRHMILDLAAVKFGLLDPTLMPRYLTQQYPPTMSRDAVQSETAFVSRVEQVVTRFWQLLFSDTTVAHQCFVWSRVIVAVEAAAALRSQQVALCADDLVSQICNNPVSRQMHLPHLESWQEVLESLCEVHQRAFELGYLHAGVPLPVIGANDRAMGSLQQPTPEVFAPNYIAPSSRLRNDDRHNEVKYTLYPVEVMPVLPSNFETLMRALQQEEEESPVLPLAGRCGSDCTVVYVQGIKQQAEPRPTAGTCNLVSRKRERSCTLHTLLDGKTLLMARDVPPVVESGATAASLAHQTVTYTTSREHMVNEYLVDTANTSSYLFQVRRKGVAGYPDATDAHPKGSDFETKELLQRCGSGYGYGGVALYDCVPNHRAYRKDPVARAPVQSVYVLNFDDGAASAAAAAGSSSDSLGEGVPSLTQ